LQNNNKEDYRAVGHYNLFTYGL